MIKTRSLAGSAYRKPVPAENISISPASELDREKIYRLRHEVYTDELQQHPPDSSATQQDSLDGGNTYIVARCGGAIAGFISITPPSLPSYSIDKYFAREGLPFPFDDGLYEIRLLTVLKPYRGSDVATMLMYAAFRWVESHGGSQIVAIGRREILDLYLKVGLQRTGQTTCCGRVNYDLLHATVSQIRTVLDAYRGSLARMECKVTWQLDFNFQKPAGCFHGGASFKAIGERFEALERSATVINADVLDAWFSPSPLVITALQNRWEWLLKTSPPTRCDGFIEAVAEARRIKPIHVLPGAGSSDLIFRAFRHWLTAASHVLILEPTYGEYAHVLEQVIGCTVDRLPLLRENNYDVDLDRLRNAFADAYDLVVLVNPNSPTGRHLPRVALESLLRKAPASTRFWVDETYVDYLGQNESLERFAAQSENVIVCKSMSKVYALSGARAAYLCASAHQLETLHAITPPWAISLTAQVAAVRALQDPTYYHQRYTETHCLREALGHHLAELGWRVVPGVANFLLAHLPAHGLSAPQLIGACQQQELFLRDASSMGSTLGSGAIRIAVKDAATNLRMVSIIASVQRTHARP